MQSAKFIYSEKATKFCEISTLDLIVCSTVKSKVEILQNFVAFSDSEKYNTGHIFWEYINFDMYFVRPYLDNI